MNRVPPTAPSRAENPAASSVQLLHRLASGLAFANCALAMVALFTSSQLPGKPGWPEAALVFTIALATMISLARQLPTQNVVLASVVIAFVGGIIHAIGAVTAIPFGPFNYLHEIGPRMFNTLAWPIPFLWVIVILNSRGVARLILRPWRKLRSYGFWLIGITAVLAMLFDFALEPFAVAVKRYWLWQPTRLSLTWGGAPVTNFFGWFVTALFILVFATPALIDKRRQRSSNRPPDYHPLLVWVLSMILFATGDVTKQLWLAAGVTSAIAVVVAVFAVRGAKW